jgi:alanine racemase
MGGSEDGRVREQTLPGRPNRFEVDLGAIAHNAATIRRCVGPSCKIFAALKADAYGYGIAAVAPAATPSIEHTRVDVTDVPTARVGDEVVVIGRQGDSVISAEEVAACQGLLSPGLVALAIRETVPRVYRGGGVSVV